MARSFYFDQVSKHFGYLVDELGFSIVREYREPQYSYEAVVFQSQDCRIRVARERSAVHLDISPPVPLKEDWWYLGTIIAYLTGGTDKSLDFRTPEELDHDSTVEQGLQRFSVAFRKYATQICEVFASEDFERRRAELMKR